MQATILTPDSIEDYLNSLSVRGLSGLTIRAYGADLSSLLNWPLRSQFENTSFEVLASRFLNETVTKSTPATVNRKLAAFKGFAKFHGHPSILMQYKAPKAAKPRPHPLPEGIQAVHQMALAAKTPDERAIVALLGLVGLRVSEAREVRPSHFDMAQPMQPILRVYGKGNKQRDVAISSKAWAVLHPIYNQCVTSDCRFILLSDSAARRTWTRVADRAGVSRRSSSHDGRATMATAMLQNGANVRVVQEHLGHASLETTQIYLGVSMQEMRKAVEL